MVCAFVFVYVSARANEPAYWRVGVWAGERVEGGGGIQLQASERFEQAM
jgi:hypothetical protein